MSFDLFMLIGLALLIVICAFGYVVARRTEDENTRLHARLAAYRAGEMPVGGTSGIRR